MIIGIAGKKGSGKNFVGSLIQSEINVRTKKYYKTVAFADSLKLGISRLLNINLSWLNSSHKDHLAFDINTLDVKEWDCGDKDQVSLRYLLQYYGMITKKILGDDIFVKLALNDLIGNIIITDVRFPEEVEAIKAKGGVVINIINPEEEDKDRDISENALNGFTFDYEIVNDKRASVSMVKKDIRQILDNINL